MGEWIGPNQRRNSDNQLGEDQRVSPDSDGCGESPADHLAADVGRDFLSASQRDSFNSLTQSSKQNPKKRSVAESWAQAPHRLSGAPTDLPSPTERLLSQPCADPFDESQSGWLIARHQATKCRGCDNERGSALAWWIHSRFYKNYSDENNKRVLYRYVYGEQEHSQAFIIILDIMACALLLTGSILTLVFNGIAHPVRPRNIIAISLYMAGLLYTQLVQLFFHCLALGGKGRPRSFAALSRMDLVARDVALYLCALWPATLVLDWSRYTLVVSCAGSVPFISAILFSSIMGQRCPLWLIRSFSLCLWLCAIIIFCLTQAHMLSSGLSYQLRLPCRLFRIAVFCFVCAEVFDGVRWPRRCFHELSHLSSVLGLCCLYSMVESVPRGIP